VNRQPFPRYASRRTQRGQSLIEYVIYIGLAALAIAGFVYFAFVGNSNTAVNSESDNLTFIVSSARKLYYNSSTGYSGVSASVLINNGVIPDTEVTGTTITSSFGTPITVAAGTLYNANDALALTYLVPPGNCSAFVSSVQSQFDRIQVAGSTEKDTTVGTAFQQSNLGTACASSAGASVTVIFTASR
jgi:Tfp pilus assembly protein PilW